MNDPNFIIKETKNEKFFSAIKEFRYNIGYEMLMLMERHDDLPLPNISRLSKTIQEYYNREGIQDIVKDAGYKWKPDVKYWEQNIKNISYYMSKEYKDYFGYLRTEGLKGEWKFMNKGEYEKYLKWTHQDISTRVDAQNEKVESAERRWKINIPKIADIPRLP